MRKRWVIIILFVLAGALLLSALAMFSGRKRPEVSAVDLKSALPVIASQPMFFEFDNFQNALARAQAIAPRADIHAVVVPQHLLASSLIAAQIKRASGRRITSVAIIGPNHFNAGVERIASAAAVWQTEFGEATSDSALTSKFISDFGLLGDAEVFANEHAIGAVVPFVKYYLPEAKILPIVFNSYATLQDAEKVSAWLADNLPRDSLVIYSIDFSHYLPREEADLKDIETRAFIEGAQVSRIMALGNDHLDSPASLAAALLYADKKNLRADIVATKNSDDFSIERTQETTSYFIITFSPDDAPEKRKAATLLFAGDVMLSRAVGDAMILRKDWCWPFRLSSAYTRKADIFFGNLEGPISARGKSVGSPYPFRADPKAAEGLSCAGFDVMSVANNHIGDWSRAAAEDTFRILQENNIAYAGGGFDVSEAHAAKVIEANGAKFGFLAYTPYAPRSIIASEHESGVAAFSVTGMVDDIKAAKIASDAVIVSLHFGDEYARAENANQRNWAHAAIDAGAKLVIGHHPHVVQRVEQYKDGYIAYSLGNFVFDQTFSSHVMEGLLLKVVFERGEIASIAQIKVEISNSFQAIIAQE
ncbi:MAG: AmmeMemoRadiSam system protein B [Patescibacteria group bacterium]